MLLTAVMLMVKSLLAGTGADVAGWTGMRLKAPTVESHNVSVQSSLLSCAEVQDTIHNMFHVLPYFFYILHS